VDVADGMIAILATNGRGDFSARWEIYTVVDGLEVFSHFATRGEAIGIVASFKGLRTAEHFAACPELAPMWGMS
jgi:hypothetical protein